MVSNVSLQVFIRELHNSLLSDQSYGGIYEARDVINNYIISASTLCMLFPLELKQISA